MKHYLALASLIVMSLQSSGVGAAPPAMVPGNWKFDITYDLIGIKQTFPGYSVTQCLSDSAPYPSITPPSDMCQEALQGRFSHTVTWQLNCSDEWEMVQGMGRIHYQHGEARGDVHLQILNPHNPPQAMSFSIKGRRIGSCDS